MKPIALFLALLSLSLGTVTAAHATPILTSSVTGTLDFNATPTINRFTPATTNVTAGTTPEFTYTVGGDTFTANFGALGFIIDIDCTSACTIPGFTETFTDTAFTGDGLLTDLANNNLGLTHSISGDVITLTFTAQQLASGDTTSTFELLAPTPEPGSLLLVGTGLLSVAGTVRRRFRKP